MEPAKTAFFVLIGLTPTLGSAHTSEFNHESGLIWAKTNLWFQVLMTAQAMWCKPCRPRRECLLVSGQAGPGGLSCVARCSQTFHMPYATCCICYKFEMWQGAATNHADASQHTHTHCCQRRTKHTRLSRFQRQSCPNMQQNCLQTHAAAAGRHTHVLLPLTCLYTTKTQPRCAGTGAKDLQG